MTRLRALPRPDGNDAPKRPKRALAAATDAPALTITIPPSALPSVTVTAPPPALVTRRNSLEHLGLTGPELLRVLRAMKVHPRFGGAVIACGKIRGAAPDAILEYLRAAPSVVEADEDDDQGDEDEDEGPDPSLLAAVGFTAPVRRGGGRR